MSKLPGGALSKRPMHFIWIVDCSGSMAEKAKIQILNNAVREAIPHMQKESEDNPHADVLVRVIKFSTGAQWVTNTPVPVSQFKWIDLEPDGETDMGKAFSMVADYLKIPPMTDRGLPPVLVLVSDGQPTDNYSAGLKDLFDQPWGRRAVRIAILVGPEAEADQNVFQRFIGSSERKPLVATNAPSLVRYIKWASTAVVKSASASPSQSKADEVINENVIIPSPPTIPQDTGDVPNDEPW